MRSWKREGEAQFAKTLFMGFGPDSWALHHDTDNFRIQKFDETGNICIDIQMEGGQ